MGFRDRNEAGERLAEMLAGSGIQADIIGAIPRGGAVVAAPVAIRLGLPLELIHARKLTADIHPEFAFGALDPEGGRVLDAQSVALLGLGPLEIEEAVSRVRAEIEARHLHFPSGPIIAPGRRRVIVVDDGLATGLTMRAAVLWLRRHGATEITVAVPCAASDTAERLRRGGARVVALFEDPDFGAVGAWYDDFRQTSDAEVVEALDRARRVVAGVER